MNDNELITEAIRAYEFVNSVPQGYDVNELLEVMPRLIALAKDGLHDRAIIDEALVHLGLDVGEETHFQFVDRMATVLHGRKWSPDTARIEDGEHGE